MNRKPRDPDAPIPWRPWLRRAQRLVELVDAHPDVFKGFTIEWLDRERTQENSLSGVVEWLEREKYVTVPLIIAIQNTERAVRKMIRFKEKKAKL